MVLLVELILTTMIKYQSDCEVQCKWGIECSVTYPVS